MKGAELLCTAQAEHLHGDWGIWEQFIFSDQVLLPYCRPQCSICCCWTCFTKEISRLITAAAVNLYHSSSHSPGCTLKCGLSGFCIEARCTSLVPSHSSAYQARS